MQSLFFPLMNLCSKALLKNTLGSTSLRPHYRMPEARRCVRATLCQRNCWMRANQAVPASNLRDSLYSWSWGQAAVRSGVRKEQQLLLHNDGCFSGQEAEHIPNKGLYLNPVWLVLTALIREWWEWAQAHLYLLETKEVFIGQRDPAFYICLVWSFSTIP